MYRGYLDLTGVGSIDPNTGLYTASSTAGSATITATSIYDRVNRPIATVTVVTADPTITSGKAGWVRSAPSFKMFIVGHEFHLTTNVFISGVQCPHSISWPRPAPRACDVSLWIPCCSTTPTRQRYGHTLDNRQPAKGPSNNALLIPTPIQWCL